MTDYKHRIKERAVYVMGGKCQCCGYNKSIRALHFHHVDEATKKFSISSNVTRNWEDTLSELRKCVLVCSNCHMEIHDGLIECPSISINEERVAEINELVSLNKKQEHHCLECGAEVYQKNSLCLTCAGKKRRKVEHPTRETLKELIQTKTFLDIGKIYGVSDNAVRKWCKNENLPYRSRDIKLIEDWDKI
jgi:hypothetical protein